MVAGARLTPSNTRSATAVDVVLAMDVLLLCAGSVGPPSDETVAVLEIVVPGASDGASVAFTVNNCGSPPGTRSDPVHVTVLLELVHPGLVPVAWKLRS